MNHDNAFGKPPDPHKRTTKVNIAVVLAVAIFFAIGAVGLWWVWHNSPS